jgi:hypothetical protein
LGGPESRSGHGGEEKNSKPLTGLEHPIIHPIAQRYTIDLSRLRQGVLFSKIEITFGFKVKIIYLPASKFRGNCYPEILLEREEVRKVGSRTSFKRSII